MRYCGEVPKLMRGRGALLMESQPPRGIGVYCFSEDIGGKTVYFNVLRLRRSFMVWLGHKASMQGLAMAVNMPRVGHDSFLNCLYSSKEGDPVAVQLLGSSTDVTSSSLAYRLGISMRVWPS